HSRYEVAEVVEAVGGGDLEIEMRRAVDLVAQQGQAVAGLDRALVRQIRRLVLRHGDARVVVRVVGEAGADHGAQRYAVGLEQLVGNRGALQHATLDGQGAPAHLEVVGSVDVAVV